MWAASVRGTVIVAGRSTRSLDVTRDSPVGTASRASPIARHGVAERLERVSSTGVPERFRTDELRMLQCAVGETGCTTFILCAPIDHYLTGLGLHNYPAAGTGLYQISSRNAADDRSTPGFLPR